LLFARRSGRDVDLAALQTSHDDPTEPQTNDVEDVIASTYFFTCSALNTRNTLPEDILMTS